MQMARRSISAAVIAAAFFTACYGPKADAAIAATPQFHSTITFGDSLVDAGNYYIASGGTYPDAEEGFFEGRNTNGYDYTDLLSLEISGAATKASLAGGDNYAFGGARVLGGSYPDFLTQIGRYQAHLADTGSHIDPTALFTVTFGDNDVAAIDAGDYGGLGSRDAALRAVAAQYAAGIQELVSLGAKNILFTGFLYLDTSTSYELQDLLNADLAQLNVSTGTNLYSYSILDFFDRAAKDPVSVGLPSGLQTTVSCRAAGAAPNCSDYLFFDGDHPTAASHQAILNDMNSKLGLFDQTAPVPEPATWIMMIVGFAFAGMALRLSRASSRVLPKQENDRRHSLQG
jgi:outer membrane lipase/esterase